MTQCTKTLIMSCTLPIQLHPCRCGAACLAHADAVASKAETLMLASHLLTPVAVDKMPEWAKELVKGQEDAFLAQQVRLVFVITYEIGIIYWHSWCGALIWACVWQ